MERKESFHVQQAKKSASAHASRSLPADSKIKQVSGTIKTQGRGKREKGDGNLGEAGEFVVQMTTTVLGATEKTIEPNIQTEKSGCQNEDVLTSAPLSDSSQSLCNYLDDR